jgi:signal transduction histidine kinase
VGLSFQQAKGWLNSQTTARQLAATNQRLEAETQLKDRFLSITSHELRAPLTRIAAQSQLVQRRLKQGSQLTDRAAIVQALGRIDEQTQVLATMMHELLDFSRIQRQTMTLERALLDMNRLCLRVVEDQRLITGRTVRFQGTATPATVYGDARRLTQMMSNLLTNAIKYSPASSPVVVTVAHDEQCILLHIHDDGWGIEQSQLDKIFEAFYRTPEAQSEVTDGPGLGLAISKQIVDLHQGGIWCVSEQGQGTTFSVALPFRSSPPV